MNKLDGKSPLSPGKPAESALRPQGVPGANVAAYYKRRAESEVGLILSEGTVVNRPASKSDPNIPSFYGDASFQGWNPTGPICTP